MYVYVKDTLYSVCVMVYTEQDHVISLYKLCILRADHVTSPPPQVLCGDVHAFQDPE